MVSVPVRVPDRKKVCSHTNHVTRSVRSVKLVTHDSSSFECQDLALGTTSFLKRRKTRQVVLL